MGISRDSRHKRRLTGGRRPIHQKKRKYELARPGAFTKLGSKRVAEVRVRGGNLKYRALRLDVGNFSWGSEHVTRKARVLDVVYNASNNELVRTKTLVKNAIIQVDATPFRLFYEKHFGVTLGKKKKEDAPAAAAGAAPAAAPAAPGAASTTTTKTDEKKAEKKSLKAVRKLKRRNRAHELAASLKDQFNAGRLYACISSRPGQSGRCDGYILEGRELEFYLKKLTKKK
jgi:small subunit ribosomal protein S8e